MNSSWVYILFSTVCQILTIDHLCVVSPMSSDSSDILAFSSYRAAVFVQYIMWVIGMVGEDWSDYYTHCMFHFVGLG